MKLKYRIKLHSLHIYFPYLHFHVKIDKPKIGFYSVEIFSVFQFDVSFPEESNLSENLTYIKTFKTNSSALEKTN